MIAALVALIPTLGAFVPVLSDRAGRNICSISTGLISLTAFVLLMTLAPGVISGEEVGFRAAWIPELGLNFSFFVDGLGLFFASLILLMGLLVILYARFYLASADPMGRFYAFLLLFQGAMLGIVLSDNIILMLVFWELTSLSSFLLIGYWNHLPESRQGARMSLIVTGGGGLALIGGMLMLGSVAGTYELSEIIQRRDVVVSSPLFVPMLGLILIGAFTKSAQFPFHFWLPHAMAAPTPVSAYLHSATMVKAGIFLLARLWPVFAGTEMWFLVVSLAGLTTMVVGAWIAIFRDDLKALLAYSTVSHLGLITMLLGLGTRMAAVTAVLHILNHATFKAALFMSAGIVDHETHTRSIAKLGGLRKLMPITATLAIIASLAMAGIPLFNGFVSKEMMLEEASHTVYGGMPWLFPLLATLGALFSVAYSARLLHATFFGETRFPDAKHPPHDPPLGMWLPVAILVVPVIVFGLVPGLAEPIVRLTAAAVINGELPNFYLSLWHGVTPALVMSIIAVAGGLLLLAAYGPIEQMRQAAPRPEAKPAFERTVRAGAAGASGLTTFLHNNDLSRYMFVIVLAVAGLGAAAFFNTTHGGGTADMLGMSLPAMVGWLALLTACGVAVVRHHDRLLMLIVTAIAGLVVSLVFLQFSAPDLALTQISVEVVATILMLLALNLLPKSTPHETSAGLRAGHGVTALFSGVAVGALALSVLTRGYQTISDYHIAQAKPGGGGTNVVNVILVDFRGYDTYGEIIVLGIAALVIFALLDLGPKARQAAGAMARPLSSRSGEPHPIMLVVVTRVLLPLALTVGIFIFLRGHNMPGGGFISGIVVAIAFIMQYVASGYAWAHDRRRLDGQLMISAGILIAGATGVASWLFGSPFLTSTYDYFHIPLIGEVELASALAFDLGVFLVVVGTVLLSLSTISRAEAIGDEMEQAGTLPKPALGPEPAASQPAAPAPFARERQKEPV
ncbi:monovalent cation/H+ antiporter subunit A [Lutibaculum baratangense]|uniref:Na(+) H(+) antiporter subunit A n=1 Tax=Lutibaculum baratangense AMV1 TaxID=631454 RepID=V4TMB5_9HYPH|nr:monovalent cation/H+ antiporter subunit A [Lutibaculum baratangense]ESR26878.1 Na(+) H(+) antiporter subunit A [Lutibaculum baratangense AMV1]